MKMNLHALKDRRPHLRLWKSRFSDYVNPTRDWSVGLFLATVLFIGWALYVAYDFYSQFIVPPQIEVPGGSEALYKEKDVLSYAETYRKREELFILLRKTRTATPISLEQDPVDAVEEDAVEEEPLAGNPVAE